MPIPTSIDSLLGETLVEYRGFAEQVLPRYIESARSYAQLAAGALALSVGFKEKVLGQDVRVRPTLLLISSWFCLVVTVGASAWYQYVAVKLIGQINSGLAKGMDPSDMHPHFPLTVSWLWPGPAYGVMVASFFLGAVLFMLAAVHQLMETRRILKQEQAGRCPKAGTGELQPNSHP